MFGNAQVFALTCLCTVNAATACKYSCMPSRCVHVFGHVRFRMTWSNIHNSIYYKFIICLLNQA